MGAPAGWALQQIVGYLSEFTPRPGAAIGYDPAATALLGVERAVEALDCEFGAFVRAGEVVATVGFGLAGPPAGIAEQATATANGELTIPNFGTCMFLQAPVDDGALIVARSADVPFTAHDTTLVRAMARVLALTLRTASAISTERDLRRISEEQAREAWVDPLTRLGNRKLFHQRLSEASQRSGALGHSIAVMFMDLDGFKLVNDTMGHDSGDELLVAVGRRLAGAVRSVDTVARLGGDEFAVVIDGVDHHDVTVELVARVQAALAAPFGIAGRDIVVSASIGIASGHPDRDDPAALLRDADVAMYVAKAAGRGRHVFFEPQMRAAVLARVEMEADLRAGLRDGALCVHYQPVVDLFSTRLIGFEALVRWRHPQRGLIPPADFLPLAQEADLMPAVGEVVLERAAADLGVWRREFAWGSRASLGINLSGVELARTDLAELVATTLAQSGVPAHRVILEITEDAVVNRELDASIAALEQLRAVGTLIALDDFGTGYASLSHLLRLPVDVLKVDRSFITGVSDSRDRAAIASTILALSRQFGFFAVGEGVETEADLRWLKQAGCAFGQGDLFARPMPAGDVANWVERFTRSGQSDELVLTN